MVGPIVEDGRAQAPALACAVILDHIARLPRPSTEGTQFSDAGKLAASMDAVRARRGDVVDAWAAEGVMLAACAARALSPPPVPGLESMEPWVYWRHAFEVGCVADQLNAHGRLCERAVTFTAAILHDVGKLVLAHVAPKSYARVIADAQRRHRVVILHEHEIFGTDHADVGALLAAHWSLSRPVQDAIRLHHVFHGCEETTGDARLISLIQLADALCCPMRSGHPGKLTVSQCRLLGRRIGIDDIPHATMIEEAKRYGAEMLGRWAAHLGLGPSHGRRGRPRDEWDVPTVRQPSVAPPLALKVMAAATRFVEHWSPEAGELEVCTHVVRCVSDAMGLDSVVAFFIDRRHSVYFCGAWHRGSVWTRTVIGEPPSPATGSGVPGGEAVALHRGVGPAPSIAEPVLHRFRSVFAAESPWMLPIVHVDELVGGVLFEAELHRFADCPSTAEALSLLSALFGAAGVQTRDRTAARRSANALADRHPHPPDAVAPHQGARSASVVKEMAAGVAHELNTPLAVIAGRAQLLASQVDEPELKDPLETIQRQARTCSEIVDQLVALASPRTPQPAVLILEPWLLGLRESWLGRDQPRPYELHVGWVSPVIRVYADPAQLRMILDALVENALEAVPSERPCVRVNSPSIESDDTVVIAVQDDGPGMTADVLERAFDPFFSHRPAGRRRGMGLTLARRLAELNGGRLWIESGPSAGTTAFVELPAAPETLETNN